MVVSKILIMKRPAVFLSVLFIAMITSTTLVSTAISGICRAFDTNDGHKSINIKATPVDKQENDQFKQASAKL